jgi:hypothetical protein
MAGKPAQPFPPQKHGLILPQTLINLVSQAKFVVI